MGRVAALLSRLPTKFVRDQTLLVMFHEFPNRAAALAAMSLYAAVSCILLGLTIKTRSWFMLLAVVAGLLEMVSFALRTALLDQTRPDTNAFLAMFALLVVSPLLLRLTNYICAAKLLTRTSQDAKQTTSQSEDVSEDQQSVSSCRSSQSRLGSSRFKIEASGLRTVLKTYIPGFEAVAICLQCIGGGMISMIEHRKMLEQGPLLILAGFCMQTACLLVFACIALCMNFSKSFGCTSTKTSVTGLFICLHANIACLLLRNCYRIAEFSQGMKGYLISHEQYMYGLDVAPMLCCLLLLCVFHYGWYLGGPAITRANNTAGSSSSSGSSIEGLQISSAAGKAAAGSKHSRLLLLWQRVFGIQKAALDNNNSSSSSSKDSELVVDCRHVAP